MCNWPGDINFTGNDSMRGGEERRTLREMKIILEPSPFSPFCSPSAPLLSNLKIEMS